MLFLISSENIQSELDSCSFDASPFCLGAEINRNLVALIDGIA
jgi:hypothetical protein